MFGMKTLSLLIVLSAITLVLVWTSISSARPFRPEKLPDQGENWGCATCHVNPAGGGPRNAFGRDYEAIALPAGDVYTKELGRKDSDGDGFTNDQEFEADPPTEPWNVNSKPPKPPESQAVKPNGKLATTWARMKQR